MSYEQRQNQEARTKKQDRDKQQRKEAAAVTRKSYFVI